MSALLHTDERFKMPEAYFHKLAKPEKAPLLCRIAEQYLQDGKRVLIIVDDENQGITLDRFMWSWNKGSFVPHVYDNGAVDCLNDPVVIASHEENSNGAQVLIMGSPCSMSFINRFEIIVDFAELHNDNAANASRKRFAAYREAGFKPRMCE